MYVVILWGVCISMKKKIMKNSRGDSLNMKHYIHVTSEFQSVYKLLSNTFFFFWGEVCQNGPSPNCHGN